jgi:hypothetical protein
MGWLKHAFAVDPPGEAQPNELQSQVIDALCRRITRMHLTTPALLLLESSRPLNFLGSQALHFFMPFVSAIADASGVRAFAAFLEQRGSIDYLCHRLEAFEDESASKVGPAPQPKGPESE